MDQGWWGQLKIVVTAYRYWQSVDAIVRTLDHVASENSWQVEMGVGDCPTGGDVVAQAWAVTRQVPYRLFLANWEDLGKRAGIVRNEYMIDTIRPDLVVAFLNPRSRGALHCRNYAREHGYDVFEVWEGQ
jgi:YspA, cpYpsA-related SLOG family